MSLIAFITTCEALGVNSNTDKGQVLFEASAKAFNITNSKSYLEGCKEEHDGYIEQLGQTEITREEIDNVWYGTLKKCAQQNTKDIAEAAINSFQILYTQNKLSSIKQKLIDKKLNYNKEQSCRSYVEYIAAICPEKAKYLLIKEQEDQKAGSKPKESISK